jgi:hypothetical protein
MRCPLESYSVESYPMAENWAAGCSASDYSVEGYSAVDYSVAGC